MINLNDTQTALEFGEGDICVTSGSCIGDKNATLGVVCFSNQKAREIGSVGEVLAEEPYSLQDFPVAMTFTKVESIDVVIDALLEAKKNMALTK